MTTSSVLNRGAVMYGCPPPEPVSPWTPPTNPFPVYPLPPAFTPTHLPCSKCNRHIRVNEICPWCHTDAVKEAILAVSQSSKLERVW